MLKREQALHVDFAAFPQNVIDLLNVCLCTEETPAKYMAEMIVTNKIGTLTIYELNRFKNLQHLSLQFREGNDGMLKKYLADRMMEFKGKYLQLFGEMTEHRNSVVTKDREVVAIRDDMQRAREAHAASINDLKAVHAAELVAQREAALGHARAEAQRADEQRRTLEREGRATVASVTAQFEAAAATARTESAERLAALATAAAVQQQLDRVNADLTANRAELKSMRDKVRQFDELKFASDTAQQKFALYESQLKEKDDLIAKLSALYDSGSKQKNAMEETVATFKAQVLTYSPKYSNYSP